MKISLGGDVCVTKDCTELFKKGNASYLFNDVTDVFKSCDRNIVNLECAVTDKNTPIKKFGPNLAAPFGTIEVLKEAGITDCGLSNNHVFDFGKAGLCDTLAELEKNGIKYTGIGENDIDARQDMIIDDGNKKIAVIAVCEHEYSYALPDRVGCREYDPYDTTDDIIEAKKIADYVVVIYHGGKELCRYPSPRLLKLCRSMVKHGADLVLCQHSHCIGCYEEYMGGHILYGQGNFHFVYTEMANRNIDLWNNGILVKADFDDKLEVELIPTVVDGCSIRLAHGEEKDKLLSELYERSKSLHDGTWRDGWHKFCEENRDNYSKQQNTDNIDIFAHYLDCEAHTDAWRELFPTWNLTNEK